jgi:hypothetical protein
MSEDNRGSSSAKDLLKLAGLVIGVFILAWLAMKALETFF